MATPAEIKRAQTRAKLIRTARGVLRWAGEDLERRALDFVQSAERACAALDNREAAPWAARKLEA